MDKMRPSKAKIKPEKVEGLFVEGSSRPVLEGDCTLNPALS